MVCGHLATIYMHQSASGQGCKALNLVTGVRIPSGVQNFNSMGYIAIIIGMAILLGWIISQVIRDFSNNNELGYKIMGIAMVTLTISLICAFSIGLREEIRYNALEQYFNGEVEVIQDSTVTRTYKFN